MTDLSYAASFDLETTGVSVLNDRIVTSSVAYLGPDNSLIDNWEWIVDPGVEIPEGASNVHGITTEIAQRDGQTPAQAVYEIAGIVSYFLNNAVPTIAYNAAYDFSLLNAEIQRHLGYENGLIHFLDKPENLQYIVDPYLLDQQLDKWRKGSRTLTANAKHYGVVLDNAHTSFADCVAAAGVARGIWNKYPILAGGNFPDLFDLQVRWYQEMMESRAEYFKSKNKEMNDFSTVWPIRT